MPPTDTTLVILAAGRGSRMGRSSADRPKAMLEINGQTLLDHQLAAARRHGFKRANTLVIGGYSINRLVAHVGTRARVVYNPLFEVANNIVSLWAAIPYVSGGMLVLNSDVLFDPEAVGRVLAAGNRNLLAIRREGPITEEDMKVTVAARGRITRIGKDIPPGLAAGEYVGLAKFNSNGVARLRAALEHHIGGGGAGSWYESAIGRTFAEMPVHALWLDGLRVTEIDTPEDLRRARQMFRGTAR